MGRRKLRALHCLHFMRQVLAELASSSSYCVCRINGETILCVKSDLWLTEAGEKEGKFFFRLLKPSPE